MGIKEIVHSRTGAVVAGAAVLVTIGGVGGAVAAGQITSSDIRDQTIKQRDIARAPKRLQQSQPGLVPVHGELPEERAGGTLVA